MPTQPGTFGHYNEFFNHVMSLLDWRVPPEQIVWHYTNGNSLIKIVESGRLFSTQVGSLNDTTEIRYAASRLRAELIDLLPQQVSGGALAAFLQRYIDLIDQQHDIRTGAELQYFVTCFTTLDDDLGQWRSYGGGENGYAIGIKAGDLAEVPGESVVAKVNYKEETHVLLAKQAAAATVHYYDEGSNLGIEDWDNKFLAIWDSTLTHLAPLFKDPGFGLESEVRVIHRISPDEFQHLRVLQRKTMMSRHLPLQFPKGGGTSERPRLPIAKVMVGPGRHKEMTRLSVETLLRVNGYIDASVVSSKLPYQDM